MIAEAHLNRVFLDHWNDLALISTDRSFSFADLYNQAAGIASWLGSQGARQGDYVALNLPNGWPFAASYMACILGGFNFVPVNPELSCEDQDYIRNRIQPKFVIDDPAVIAAVEPLREERPSFNEGTGDILTTFFTSGTTGRPKGVVHSINVLLGNAIAFCQTTGMSATSRMYHILPMAYMAGFLNTLLCPWSVGGCAVIGPRFTPQSALNFWEEPISLGVNTIWLTPTIAAIITRMARDKGIASKISDQMENIFCGTAPLAPTIRSTFRETFGCALQESYGMSEILFVSVQGQQDAKEYLDVGKVLPGISIQFSPAAESDENELVISTPWILQKYLLEDGEASPLHADGGMPTGDIAQYNGDRLKITGRLKDLIIRGGVNVSPAAVEEVLLSVKGVQDSAVVGIADPIWGEKIVACIVTNTPALKDEIQSNLKATSKQLLASSMQPDMYVWLDSLPRASSGKIQKFLLKEQLT